MSRVPFRRLAVARRPRSYVRVAGPDAEDYLQRMLSNDVAGLAPGESCEALLLTAKARMIATLRVLRQGADEFLLLTEPELGEKVVSELQRMRFAARAKIELEEHTSHIVFGGTEGIATEDYGLPAVEVLDSDPAGDPVSEQELELLRIEAGTPRHGREIDERVLPAEAGVVERTVSFTKGCYPGQEPIARLHYRGHPNRELRVLELEASEVPSYDEVLRLGDKEVGRVTSAARRPDGTIVALGYVRVGIPDDAVLEVGSAAVRLN